jgi:phage baseplate assembly protein W
MRDLAHLQKIVNENGRIDATRGFTPQLNLSAVGPDILDQLIVKGLLTSRGSDTSMPNFGIGLHKLAVIPSDSQGADTVRVNIAIGIKAFEGQIKDLQKEQVLPDNMRLEELRVYHSLPIVYLPSVERWFVPLQRKTYDGTVKTQIVPVPAAGGSEVSL